MCFVALIATGADLTRTATLSLSRIADRNSRPNAGGRY
jgi:hypothetical protein